MLGRSARAASQTGTAGRRAAQAIVSGTIDFIGHGLNRIGNLLFNVIKNISHVGYENIISAIYQSTQQTMPENWMQKPENTEQVKTWGRYTADVAFFLFTTLPGWIMGFVFIPTIFHSFQSAQSFIQIPIKFLYADRHPEDLTTPQLHGKIYGLLGALGGFVIGTLVALFWLSARIMEQSWHTTVSFWTNLVNWSVQDVRNEQALVQKIKVDPYRPQQTSFEKVLGVFPLGWATSVTSGTLTLGAIATGRFVLNTFVSTWRNFSRGLNWSVSDMYQDETQTERTTIVSLTEDKRNRIQRVLFGWVGEVFGGALGATGFAFVLSGRLIANSAESFVRVLFSSMQVGLKNSRLHHLFDLSADKRDHPSYGFSKQLGYPGYYGLGPVAIITGVLAGFTLRFLQETITSSMNASIVSFNIVLNGVKGYEPLVPRQPERNIYERGIGILGYPLGVLLVLPMTISILGLRYIITNLDTAQKVARFFTITASSLHGPIEVHSIPASQPDNQTDEVNPLERHIHAQEIIAQETTLKRFFSWVEEVFRQDGRPVYIQILSLPGALLGTAIGGSWRTVLEAAINSIDSATRVINAALYKSKFQGYFSPIKPNRNTLEALLASPGYLIGAGIAVAPFATISLVRWIITNGDTANRAFIATINWTRPEHEHLPESDADQRPQLVRYSTFLGAGAGILLGLSREVGINSIQSLRRQVFYLSKSALFESSYESKIPDLTEDHRQLPQKRLGYPGLVLGSLMGSIGYVSISFGRIVGNTLITTYHTVRDMVDFVFLDDYPTTDTFAESRRMAAYWKESSQQHVALGTDENDHNLSIATPVQEESFNQRREDQRKNYPFLLGIPGFILGGSLGLVSAFIAGSGRIAWSSLLTAYNTTLSIADTILPENMATTAFRQPELKPIPRLLGYLPGKTFGTIFGAIAWVSILIGRTAINTGLSAFLTARVITSFPPISGNILPLNDPRGDWKSFDRRIGVLGYVLGIPFGIIGFGINYTIHTIFHSFITGYRSLFYVTLWAIGSTQANLLLGVDQNHFNTSFGQETRTTFERYGFGILGLIGTALGGIVASVISLIRVIALNVRLLGIGFKRGANLTLENPFAEDSMRLDHVVNKIQLGIDEITLTPDQLDDTKYMGGIAGLVTGGVIGTILVAFPVGIIRGLKESGKSYYHLSQSLLNVGLEAEYFEHGITTDSRPAKLKILGGLGYLAAVVTTGWLPVISLIGKIVLIGVAVSFSPLVAFIKLGYIYFRPRFKKLSSDELDTKPAESQMRELYNALVDGEFPATKQPLSPRVQGRTATGGKGVGDFFRKSALFNLNTLTEDILQAKLDSIRQSEDSSHILQDNIKGQIKKDHRGFFFFTTPMREKYDTALTQEFDAIEKFVDDYLDNKNPNTPEKVKKQLSLTELFYYKMTP